MTPGFTEEQRDAIAAYVRAVADGMALRDWAFVLSYEPPSSSEALASIIVVYGRKVATLFFCRHFAELPPDIARHSIVHELTHVLTDPITSPIENTLPKLIGETTWSVLWEATRERSEQATDQIADVMAPTIPMIDWTARETERVTWSDTPAMPNEPDPVVG